MLVAFVCQQIAAVGANPALLPASRPGNRDVDGIGRSVEQAEVFSRSPMAQGRSLAAGQHPGHQLPSRA